MQPRLPVVLQFYRGLLQQCVAVEEGVQEPDQEEDTAQAPLEVEGVEVYEEYAGSRVGTLWSL